MPTYDYHCETCGRDFEAYRSFTDESVPTCPGRQEGSCTSKGKGKVTKVLSVPAISFRGDGFYKNDSRGSAAKSSSDKAPKSDKAPSDASKSSEKTTEKATEKKSSTSESAKASKTDAA